MALWLSIALVTLLPAQDNTLTDEEKGEGWLLLFDGKTGKGWTAGEGALPESSIQEGALNPNKSGAYIVFHEQPRGDFVLACDFKVTPGCNSGIFVRTGNRKKPVSTGLEIQILDSAGKKDPGKGDSGALFDCLAPTRNMIKPAGEWNRMRITCKGSVIQVVLNGTRVLHADLDRWTQARQNPDGSRNKFKTPLKDFPRFGYLGFQDHGQPVWFKNVKLRPLK